nr:hypothetical protein HK105_003194 [Polyrhizophydium stewartii]
MLGRLATAALGRTPGLAARPAFTAARRRYHLPNSGVQVSGAVRAALAEGGPVVALESTIITHGMPFPQNLETALQVEAIVRQNGAVPATVAVLDGHVRVGLDDAELERLARIGMAATKTSRRDMALVAARGLAGATTVSATMIAAHKANIKVFVTGGIGGVHRGGESSMDVSADLTELGRTPVAVVSAGVKSILDIGRTLEYLETQGVTVVSYGDSDEFPSFYTRQSGFKDITPFILDKVKSLTAGSSLAAMFVSAVGDDRIGQLVLSSLQKAGLSTECVDVVPGAGTATYNAVLHGDGELLAAVADMRPTSVIKSRRVFELTDSELAAIQIITPNADELVAMSEALDRRGVPGGIEAPKLSLGSQDAISSDITPNIFGST